MHDGRQHTELTRVDVFEHSLIKVGDTVEDAERTILTRLGCCRLLIYLQTANTSLASLEPQPPSPTLFIRD